MKYNHLNFEIRTFEVARYKFRKLRQFQNNTNKSIFWRWIRASFYFLIGMDSQVQLEGRFLDIVDDAWRKDKLPEEDVSVPLTELPDPESDNGNAGESVREQENKWNDLALHQLGESSSVNPSNN